MNSYDAVLVVGFGGPEKHEDVLPFSNIPAYLPPFLLRPEQVMAITG